jgi:glycosyltransferase involved in cell wall biosynthesis
MTVRLTYLINHIDYGGAEIGMVRLVNELRPAKFNITVVTFTENNPKLISKLAEHVDLIELHLSSKVDFVRLILFYTVLSKTDILVCSLSYSVMIGSVLGSILRVPQRLAWHHNTDEISRIRESIQQLTFRLYDRILTDSEATKKAVSRCGINEAHIDTLPISGIHMNQFPVVEHDKTENIRIGTVGRLTHAKGYDYLLTCAARLPNLEFHAVGTGPLKESLRNKSPDNVTIHGHVDMEDSQLWSSFDIYFQPSRSEGLCVTVIEAMACGLPVVASRAGGITESVVDNETGYLVKQGDIDGYCAQLTHLASCSTLRQKMGDSGRKRVESKYTAEEFAAQFQDIVDTG